MEQDHMEASNSKRLKSEPTNDLNLASLNQAAMSELQSGDHVDRDVKFLIGPSREEMDAHRLIMAAHSEFMRKMFYRDGGKATDQWAEHFDRPVTLPKCDPASFRDFLNYCYSGQLNVEESSVCSLIELLDFLCARQNVIDECSMWAQQHISLDTVCEYLVLATRLRHRVQSLYDACLQWIEVNAVNAMEHGIFSELAKEELLALAQSNHLCADEMHLFRALRKRHETTKEEVDSLPFDQVRLPLMTLKQLSGPVQESGVYDQTRISKLINARIQGEIVPAKLRIPSCPPWRWEINVPHRLMHLEPKPSANNTCLNFKSSVTLKDDEALNVTISAPYTLLPVFRGKDAIRLVFSNATPNLRMKMIVPVQIKKKTPDHYDSGDIQYRRTTDEMKVKKSVSIIIDNCTVSVHGGTSGSLYLRCPVKANFVIDICYVRKEPPAVRVDVNGYHSTAISAKLLYPIKCHIMKCQPELKVFVLPLWHEHIN